MLSWWLILLLSIAYVGVLFWIAHWGDTAAPARRSRTRQALIYSLTLGVYCTSWTFYGAVGTAARAGWAYLPIYLGPILTIVFAWGMISRMVRISQRQNLTSIADFISARYGRARALAVLVTVIAVAGSVPYIALQLKAVTSGFDIVTHGVHPAFALDDIALIFAVLLALFAILFGTRQIDASEHHRGMMLAIAFESLVKLCAFVAVGASALFWLWQSGSNASPNVAPELFSLARLPDTFITQMLLASAAIFCLPRQFHVIAVEAEDRQRLGGARWMFPLYLLIFTVFVVPITYAGLQLLPNGSFSGDSFVLALPMHAGQDWLTALAFVGGFSAATGMVIVASVTLSTMVSNEIVMPLLFRIKRLGLDDHRDYSKLLIQIRRIAIIGIMLIAYTYSQLVDRSAVLAAIGLLSFAAAAQFAPPLIFGMMWPKATRRGAMAGLLTGFALWFYTLFLPSMSEFGVNGFAFVHDGPFGVQWLRPQALLVDLGVHPLSHGVAWSLLTNAGVLIVVSLLTRQSVIEKIQARAFVSSAHRTSAAPEAKGSQDIVIADLRALAERFVGAMHARRSIEDFASANGIDLTPSATADRRLIQFTERLLAGAVGSSSARVIITTALRRTGMEIGDVVMLLDETSQAIQFNRQLLEATLENMSQGVSVIDPEQRLIGWNAGYLELMGYSRGMVYVGKPIEELLRFNAEHRHGERKDIDAEVEQRLAWMRRGSPYRYESEFGDGRVIEIAGQPMPDGGHVTTYTDITESKAVETALREGEKRVRTYTDNLPAMIAYIDAERRFRFANKAYAMYARLPRAEIVGRRIKDVLDANSLLKRSPYLEAAFAGERRSFELEITGDDSRPQYTLGTYIPDLDEHGNVLGIYAMFQDISVRRRAELALVEAKEHLERRVAERTNELSDAMVELEAAKGAAEEANLSKTRFFAAAAHDLLQPINAAKLFSALLAEASGEMPTEQRELVSRVERGLDSVEDLLSALLDISRLDAGGHTPDITSFPLDDHFQTLAAQFEHTCRERGLTLRFVHTSLWVESDPALLRRILQNYISNAHRYTRDGGIVVGCRRRGDEVAICVYDTGVGIAREYQRKVFEEFERLPGSQDSAKRGLGLGLAIVQRIARLLGHPIAMRSTEGRGSCFEVLVPRATPIARDPSVEPGKTPIKDAPLAAQAVICVDNEPEILDGMRALLQRWGVRPYCASDLAEAEQALDEVRRDHGTLPKLLIVDYHLDDGRDGIEVIEKLLARAGAKIPAVVLTADRTSALRDLVQSGGYSLLFKPVKPAALRALMTSIINKSKAA